MNIIYYFINISSSNMQKMEIDSDETYEYKKKSDFTVSTLFKLLGDEYIKYKKIFIENGYEQWFELKNLEKDDLDCMKITTHEHQLKILEIIESQLDSRE